MIEFNDRSEMNYRIVLGVKMDALNCFRAMQVIFKCAARDDDYRWKLHVGSGKAISVSSLQIKGWKHDTTTLFIRFDLDDEVLGLVVDIITDWFKELGALGDNA